MKRLLTTTLLVCAVAVAGRAGTVTVFAAASLTDALTAVAQAYQIGTGHSVRFNFGASSTLAIQIKEGAPADVFFSADEAKMDNLAQAGLIAADTRRSLLSNSLVIVVNRDSRSTISSPADLARTGVGRLALAEPRTVPAGIYAKEYLQKLGLWEKVADKVIPTENVRACLAAVASGNVDAGIVYKTDALTSPAVKIAYEVPAAAGPRISYPVAVVRGSDNLEAARQFVTFLASPAARAIFARFGFTAAP